MTVVVPSADFAEHLPAGSPHRMVVPVPGSTEAEIVLDAVDGGVVAERLRAVGVDFGVAEEPRQPGSDEPARAQTVPRGTPRTAQAGVGGRPDRSDSEAQRAAQQLEPAPRRRSTDRGAVRGMLP